MIFQEHDIVYIKKLRGASQIPVYGLIYHISLTKEIYIYWFAPKYKTVYTFFYDDELELV